MEAIRIAQKSGTGAPSPLRLTCRKKSDQLFTLDARKLFLEYPY